MPTATYSVSVTSGGITTQQSVSRTNDGPIGWQSTPALPAGLAGTLSTRTDNDTGVLTVASGHGITASDTVDVYWSGGRRYNVDVTAAGATTIDIDIGSGDNLPAASTAIVVCKQTNVNITIDGDNVKLLTLVAESTDAASTGKAGMTLKDSGGATIARVDLVANVPQTWDIQGGSSNPFTGNPITNVQVTNGSSTEALTLKIIGMQDATP